VLGTACGVAFGALVGLLLTAVNDVIVAPRTGGPDGSYQFWAMLLAKLLFAPSLVASIIWAIAFWRRRSRAQARSSGRTGS